MKSDVSVSRVRECLAYEGETGIFIWRSYRGMNRVDKIGTAAGSKPNADGYVAIKLDGTLFAAHILAWVHVHGEWPDLEIDHRNNDPADNRITNLRLATRIENCRNTRMKRTNEVGIKGVDYRKRERKWRARITVAGRTTEIGYFNTQAEAATAYAAKAAELFGEFARAA